MLRITDLSLPLDHPPEALAAAIRQRLKLRADAALEFTVFKRDEAVCGGGVGWVVGEHCNMCTILVLYRRNSLVGGRCTLSCVHYLSNII